MATEQFGFLYYREQFWIEGRERYRLIRARNLKSACNKMLRVLEKLSQLYPAIRLDHDVDYNGGYLDLYKLEHPIKEYLP